MARLSFWGVEVKSGQTLSVKPGDGMVLRLSQASLGEVTKNKGSESGPVHLSVNVDDKKLVVTTLNFQEAPQRKLGLFFDRDIELSHSWESGSVYFLGYKVKIEKYAKAVDAKQSELKVKTVEDKFEMGDADLRVEYMLSCEHKKYIENLFRVYLGFREFREISEGVAVVRYNCAGKARKVKRSLQRFRVNNHPIHITSKGECEGGYSAGYEDDTSEDDTSDDEDELGLPVVETI